MGSVIQWWFQVGRRGLFEALIQGQVQGQGRNFGWIQGRIHMLIQKWGSQPALDLSPSPAVSAHAHKDLPIAPKPWIRTCLQRVQRSQARQTTWRHYHVGRKHVDRKHVTCDGADPAPQAARRHLDLLLVRERVICGTRETTVTMATWARSNGSIT